MISGRRRGHDVPWAGAAQRMALALAGAGILGACASKGLEQIREPEQS